MCPANRQPGNVWDNDQGHYLYLTSHWGDSVRKREARIIKSSDADITKKWRYFEGSTIFTTYSIYVYVHEKVYTILNSHEREK